MLRRKRRRTWRRSWRKRKREKWREEKGRKGKFGKMYRPQSSKDHCYKMVRSNWNH